MEKAYTVVGAHLPAAVQQYQHIGRLSTFPALSQLSAHVHVAAPALPSAGDDKVCSGSSSIVDPDEAALAAAATRDYRIGLRVERLIDGLLCAVRPPSARVSLRHSTASLSPSPSRPQPAKRVAECRGTLRAPVHQHEDVCA